MVYEKTKYFVMLDNEENIGKVKILGRAFNKSHADNMAEYWRGTYNNVIVVKVMNRETKK